MSSRSYHPSQQSTAAGIGWWILVFFHVSSLGKNDRRLVSFLFSACHLSKGCETRKRRLVIHGRSPSSSFLSPVQSHEIGFGTGTGNESLDPKHLWLLDCHTL